MALNVAINFPINHYGVLRLACIIVVILISASYVVGTHNRKKYFDAEFNRVQHKKHHAHHHYDSHMKNLHPNVYQDVQGYGQMDRLTEMNPPLMQGNIAILLKSIILQKSVHRFIYIYIYIYI